MNLIRPNTSVSASCSHIRWMMRNRISLALVLYLNTSAGTPSGPTALSFDSFLICIAVSNSSRVAESITYVAISWDICHCGSVYFFRCRGEFFTKEAFPYSCTVTTSSADFNNETDSSVDRFCGGCLGCLDSLFVMVKTRDAMGVAHGGCRLHFRHTSIYPSFVILQS